MFFREVLLIYGREGVAISFRFYFVVGGWDVNEVVCYIRSPCYSRIVCIVPVADQKPHFATPDKINLSRTHYEKLKIIAANNKPISRLHSLINTLRIINRASGSCQLKPGWFSR